MLPLLVQMRSTRTFFFAYLTYKNDIIILLLFVIVIITHVILYVDFCRGKRYIGSWRRIFYRGEIFFTGTGRHTFYLIKQQRQSLLFLYTHEYSPLCKVTFEIWNPIYTFVLWLPYTYILELFNTSKSEYLKTGRYLLFFRNISMI